MLRKSQIRPGRRQPVPKDHEDPAIEQAAPPGGASATGRSARPSLAAALSESEQRFRATFEQAAVGMAHVGLDGRWLRVNERLCRIVGYTRDELLQLTFQDITHPDDLDADLEQMHRLIRGEIESYSMEKRYVRRDGFLVWINLTGSCVRREDRSPEYFISVIEDIDARKQAEEALSFLADAGRLLSGSLDLEPLLENLVRFALPRLGDYVVLDLVDADGNVDGFRVAHVDPAKEALAREYRSRYQPGPGSRSPIWQAIRTGEPLAANALDDAFVDQVTADAEQARLLRALRPRSFLIQPLNALGRTVGALSFCISESDRQYDAASVALAGELAARAAVALENALLHRQAQARLAAAEEARAWADRLQALTADFAGALRPDEVGAVVTRRLREALGAAAGGIVLLTPDGREMEMVHVHGWDEHPDLLAAWRRFPATDGVPVVDAMRSGSLLAFESLEELRASYPEFVPIMRQAGFDAYVVVPLAVDGRPLGALNYNFAGHRRFTPEERGFLTALAAQAAQAIQRAALFEAEAVARRTAEAADQTKTEFLRVMSHELRTPLNAIGGYAELLGMGLHGPVTDAQRSALARIRSSQAHLLGIVEELLAFQRMGAGPATYLLEDVAILDVVEELHVIIDPAAQAKHVDVELGGVRCACRARADRARLRQVLINLLGNAVKFTPPGGRVWIDCREEGDTVVLRVHDTGIGIPGEQLERVFEPFVQLDMRLTREHGGTGLGLAISRQFARGMGGELTATSVPGRGSVFSLSVPRAAAPG
jgi:PAS domain S-box-containing protein